MKLRADMCGSYSSYSYGTCTYIIGAAHKLYCQSLISHIDHFWFKILKTSNEPYGNLFQLLIQGVHRDKTGFIEIPEHAEILEHIGNYRNTL